MKWIHKYGPNNDEVKLTFTKFQLHHTYCQFLQRFLLYLLYIFRTWIVGFMCIGNIFFLVQFFPILSSNFWERERSTQSWISLTFNKIKSLKTFLQYVRHIKQFKDLIGLMQFQSLGIKLYIESFISLV